MFAISIATIYEILFTVSDFLLVVQIEPPPRLADGNLRTHIYVCFSRLWSVYSTSRVKVVQEQKKRTGKGLNSGHVYRKSRGPFSTQLYDLHEPFHMLELNDIPI